MEQLTLLSDIARDTMQGLSAYPKYLLPKYFYDDEGSKIFQDIMRMPEYYLTRCEYEIFSTQKSKITDSFKSGISNFDLIELGSGDGYKTKVLLHHLIESETSFRYIPVDISKKANNDLVNKLKYDIPELNVEAQTGDYFHIMKKMNQSGYVKKIILFLGSNIGNFSSDELSDFLRQLAAVTNKGDKVLIGFDLKKSPVTIMKAYNDPHGHTRNFNLNHLQRLNRELGADFNIDNFKHHVEYNPVTGAMKSFLISKIAQTVNIDALEQDFYFTEGETIFMELSRKFDLEAIRCFASSFGFIIENNFSDHKGYFVDSLWNRI